MKKFLYSILFSISFCMVNAQMPYPALIGYWHNWNDANAPYIQLDAVDSRYNVIVVAFALPTSTTDMTMVFTPDGVNSSTLISLYLFSPGYRVDASMADSDTNDE